MRLPYLKLLAIFPEFDEPIAIFQKRLKFSTNIKKVSMSELCTVPFTYLILEARYFETYNGRYIITKYYVYLCDDFTEYAAEKAINFPHEMTLSTSDI